MALREKLLYAIGVEVDGAKRGLKDFRQSVLEADTTTGKFKAGASSAFDSVKANAGLFAAGAGAAIAAWGAKSVTAFTETAKAAVDLSTATGLNIEQSSRWIAVGDDYQVTAEALATGLGKVAKTLDDEKWSKYGIATRDANGSARDVNDILLDSFDTLSKVTNETERARIGQELFGKGYQSLTPLLGHTREEYEKLLATQQKGQVITAEEAKKAEKTRLAYDNLHDTLNESSLALGQTLAPAAAQSANDLADVVAIVQQLSEAVDRLPGASGGGNVPSLMDAILGSVDPVTAVRNISGGIRELGDELGGGSDSAGTFANQIDRMADSVNAATPDLGELSNEAQAAADATAEAAEHAASLGDKAANAGPKIGDMAGALDDARQHLADLNEEARNNTFGILADAIAGVADAVKTATDKVRGDLNLHDELDNITDQFDTIAEAQKHVAEDGEAGTRRYNRAVRDLQRQLLDLNDELTKNPQKKIEIATEIETGSLDDLYRILGDLTKGITVPVSFAGPKIPGFNSANGTFTPGAAPSAPTFNGVTAPSTPVPVQLDQRQITYNFPVGTNATTWFADSTVNARRNGPR